MNTWHALRCAMAASVLVCSSAQAELFRAYLASDGNDANPCTLQAPCRLLPAALSAVANGGQIWMLDSANYNTATVIVTKSVSILAVPGVVGSIVALNGGPAIAVTAANLNVALRNLVIGPVVGAVAGTHGVAMTVASNLTIENSLVADLPVNGVVVVGPGTLKIANTTIRNNGLLGVVGQEGASVEIASTQMLSNAEGGVLISGTSTGTTTASISDSIISGGKYGVQSRSHITGAKTGVSVTRSTIERTTVAALYCISLADQAELAIGYSMIAHNNNAWTQSGAGAAILSLGNNQMIGNGGSVGVLTPLAPQ